MLNVDAANKMLVKKMLVVWGVAILLFFIALSDLSVIGQFSRRISEIVPMVKGQFEKATPIGDLAGCYFGLAVLFVPIAAVFLLWRQNLLTRAKVGVQRSGGLWKYLLAVYLIGLPFCIFILVFMYFAPIEIPVSPRLFGQIVAHAMTNTYPGLLIFGSTAVLGAALFLFVVLASVLLPLLVLLNWKKGI